MNAALTAKPAKRERSEVVLATAILGLLRWFIKTWGTASLAVGS
jgi:hypothetical protein